MSEVQPTSATVTGNAVTGLSPRANRHLDSVLERTRKDHDLEELLQAVEARYSSIRTDATYLAEALLAEQRRVDELKHRLISITDREAEAVRVATLRKHQADRLNERISELEAELDQARHDGETGRLSALTERDTAVEQLSIQIRSLEAENARLTSELSDLRQRVRPLDLRTDRFADPAVALLVDGDELVLRGWANTPLSVGRTRAVAALSRLAQEREAPIEVIFSTSEGLRSEDLQRALVRVRVSSRGVPMEEALTRLRAELLDRMEVVIMTDRADVPQPVPLTHLMGLLGLATVVDRRVGSDPSTGQRPGHR